MLDIVGFPAGTALRGVGLFYATDRLGGFTDEQVAVLRSLRDASSLAVLRFALSHALTSVLNAYVGARTAPRVLNGGVRRGEGELVSAAILLTDLKGFTALADREDPLRLVGWLDEHLDALGREVGLHGGEIFKFTGDGFIAAFPDEGVGGSPCAACEGALAAARAGLAHNRALADLRRVAGDPWLAADLALHYGQVVHGNIGTADRLDFTTIGRAVNEASRIEDLCDATSRNLLMSDSFARRCTADLIDLGSFRLRGVSAPQRLWTVIEA
ncbi:MAG: adenylate/guanylate cyclase domain-containing protein [Janthinobacterium lividum]